MTGKVIAVEPKLVTVELADDIQATIKVSELSDKDLSELIAASAASEQQFRLESVKKI